MYCVGIRSVNCIITSVVLPIKERTRERYDCPDTERRRMLRTTWKYVSTDHKTIDTHTILDDVSSPNASITSNTITAAYTNIETPANATFLLFETFEYATNCNNIPASRIGIYHPLILVNIGT